MCTLCMLWSTESLQEISVIRIIASLQSVHEVHVEACMYMFTHKVHTVYIYIQGMQVYVCVLNNC